MRYSIKTLLAVCTLVAVSCAGLIVATSAWAAAFFTGALLLVLASIVAAIVRRGPARAWWIGFAILANGYFWLAMYVDGHVPYRTDLSQFQEPRLITTHLLLAVDPHFHRYLRLAKTSGVPSAAPTPVYFGGRGRMYVDAGDRAHFVQVGQSLFTLMFGLAGGWLGSWFYRRDAAAAEGGTTSP
jgi:hypothetical protein